MKHVWFCLCIAITVLVAACSSDDEGGRYAGVSTWACYELYSQSGCECAGLGRNEDLISSDPVDSCEGYDCCIGYQDEHDDWMCTCLAPGSACGPQEGWKSAAIVPKCPPR